MNTELSDYPLAVRYGWSGEPTGQIRLPDAHFDFVARIERKMQNIRRAVQDLEAVREFSLLAPESEVKHGS